MRFVRRFVAMGVLAAVLGCSDGGSSDTGASPAMFMNAYTPRTNMAATLATVSTVKTIRAQSVAYQFDSVATQSAASGSVGQLMARIDRAYLGDGAATSPYSQERLFRQGLAAAQQATDRDARDVARQSVENTLLVVLHLATRTELDAAATAARAGDWQTASASWDRAAAYWSGLEDAVRLRGTQTADAAWGAAPATLTDDDMAGRIIDMLARGRGAVDAHAKRTVIETAATIAMYGTKYFYLSMIHEAFEVEEARGKMESTAAEFAEGVALSEGVPQSWDARGAQASTVAYRARWHGDAAMVSRAPVMVELGAMYAAWAQADVARYAAGTDDDRAEVIGHLGAMIDVLDEALATNRQDVTALRARIVAANTASASGDHAGAARELTAVQTAVATLALVEAGR